MTKKQLSKLENLNKPRTLKLEIDGIPFEVKEDVTLVQIDSAVDMIVKNIKEQEFKYSVLDVMLPYYIMGLFTNLPIPMITDEGGDEYPDYQKCFMICTRLDLKQNLIDRSDIVRAYIEMLERNVWRQLEYEKARLTLLPFESLMDGLSSFYEVMDALEEYTDKYSSEDIDKIAAQLTEMADNVTKLHLVKNENDEDNITTKNTEQ